MMFAPTLVVTLMDGSEATFVNCQYWVAAEPLKGGNDNWVRTFLGEMRVDEMIPNAFGVPVSVTTIFQQSSYTEYRVSVL